MRPNLDKIDEAVLALLHLTSFEERVAADIKVRRAWKGHDWEALDRLHQKGFISDPKNKNKSVVLTEEGAERAEKLFRVLYCD